MVLYHSRDSAKVASSLIRMAKEDKEARLKALKTGYLDNLVDKRHIKRLKMIVNTFGWPTATLVGEKASRSTWLIAMHADLDPKFQKECLKLMQRARSLKPRDIPKEQVRLLKKRISYNQKYPLR